MNKSQRIKITTETKDVDKYLKVRLEQDTDTLEFMSLKLDTKEVYNMFNADYGILIGRITANGGIGVPNAKISIFIALDEDDENNGEIVSIYPYKKPTDKNKDGKRYNLLPRVGKINPADGTIHPKQPFGSFPIKEEFVTNSTYLEVYKKYYKYSTVTNIAGDYMIFGVPIGTQIIHMSCDITDIGKYSMTPAAMVTNLGYSPNLFSDDGSRIKPSNDLNDLPNIDTQEISVDVIPFWGDSENFEIGITRQDFRIRAEIVNTFIIFGSLFTDGDDSMTGTDYKTASIQHVELYRLKPNEKVNIGIASKRIGKVSENIYYYPTRIADNEISAADPKSDMVKLDKSEYSSYKRDGDFVFIINCNRKKIVTDEFGNEVVVSNDSSRGAFTEFKGFITLEYTNDEIPMDFNDWLDSDAHKRGRVTPFRYKLKIPQSIPREHSFRREDTIGAIEDTQTWRKDHSTFKGGEMYSIAKFHGTVHNDVEGQFDPEDVNGFLEYDNINEVPGRDSYNNTAVIQVNDYELSGNSAYQMPGNAWKDSRELFAANWLNFSIHLSQQGFLTENTDNAEKLRSNSNFSQNFRYYDYYFRDNDQQIAGGDFNTKWFARSDLHFTDFINVPKDILVELIAATPDQKGFKLSDLSDPILQTKIRNADIFKNGQGQVPQEGGITIGGGGKINADPTESVDPDYYFYKGHDTANCFEYLVQLGLL